MVLGVLSGWVARVGIYWFVLCLVLLTWVCCGVGFGGALLRVVVLNLGWVVFVLRGLCVCW